MDLRQKHAALVQHLRDLGRVVVACSGGVDSTCLLKVATETLGRENALGITAESPSLPTAELEVARRIARDHGFNHLVVATHELDDPNYAANPLDRCYFCKAEMFRVILPIARERGFRWVATGTNADDLGDFRPGMRAAEESGVVHPLLEAGLTKDDVRALAREAGLENWDRPAAACLASRFPRGTEITRERLQMVERAEDFLRDEIGLRQLRVRWIESDAKIECAPEEIATVLARREAVTAHLASLGFGEITVDLRGYRQGALHEGLVPTSAMSPPS